MTQRFEGRRFEGMAFQGRAFNGALSKGLAVRLGVTALGVVGAAVLAYRRLPERQRAADDGSVDGGLPTTSTEVTIPAPDGVSIDAIVIQPSGLSVGGVTGATQPLVVMPSSYGFGAREYTLPAQRLASLGGFVVVTFSARGFGRHGGVVDVADALAVQDVSTVVTWALEHTGAAGASGAAGAAGASGAEGLPSAERVGVCGVSYGAGLALLAATRDPRIVAVSAMSGWTDLRACLYPNGTASRQAIELLLAMGRLRGHPGPELRRVEAAYRAGELGELVEEFCAPRSLADGHACDDRAVAVQVMHNYHDSYFPPSQMVAFVDALQAPKRLFLESGDHASNELVGLLGFGPEPWDHTWRWFDRHLRGARPELDRSPAVTVRLANADLTLTGDSFAGLATAVHTWHAGPVQDRTGPLVSGLEPMPAPWVHQIEGGEDTLAGSGMPLASGVLQATIGAPPITSLRLIDRDHAAVWESDRLDSARVVVGSPRLTLRVAADVPDVTLVAYLYDIPTNGLATLITHKPVTVTALVPGQPREIHLDLETIAWLLKPRHRVAIVVDTADPRYASVTPRGSRIVLGDLGAAPMRLELPVCRPPADPAGKGSHNEP